MSFRIKRPASEPPTKCCRCLRSSKDLKLCSGCNHVWYCSKECQVGDRAAHKKFCYDPVAGLEDTVNRAIKDYSITPTEVKNLPWILNRLVGSACNIQLHVEPDYITRDQTEQIHAHAFRKVAQVLLDDLLGEGRGVILRDLKGAKAKFNGKWGLIVGTTTSLHTSAWKLPKQLYEVELQVGPKVTVEVTSYNISMTPIMDKRHFRHSIDFQMNPDPIPPESDPNTYLGACRCRVLHADTTWEYLDLETDQWVRYPIFISTGIESFFQMGCPHYLYRPENPSLEGLHKIVSEHSADTPTKYFEGEAIYLTMHDMTPRRIIFDTGRMDYHTERDCVTGLVRRVRRIGMPFVPRTPYHAVTNGGVDWDRDPTMVCGLCDRTEGPFIQLECCGGTVCDTEGSYQPRSYVREGQCARNHRYHTICGYHYTEGHGGDWKKCKQCESSFHPYDYAVKATSMAASLTRRRYNFDNNVRFDLDPSLIEFPCCSKCPMPVDTTEESTRTLVSRIKFSGGGDYNQSLRCNYHDGGFGVVITGDAPYSPMRLVTPRYD